MVEELLFPLEIDPKRKIGGKTEAQWQVELEAKARELCKGAKSDFEKCKAIYDWLETNGGTGGFAYKTLKSDLPKRAVQIFADHEGDCDDLAYLFMAMAKAVGVSVRVATRGERVEKEGQSHAVAAVLLDQTTGAIGPNRRFETDAAYREQVCTMFGIRGSQNRHMFFFDLTAGGFDPDGSFALEGEKPARAYNTSGLKYERAGDYSEAISAYDKAAKIDPQVLLYSKNLANCFNLRGAKNYRAGKIEDAIADYKMALKIDPDIEYSNRNLYLCYMKKGDWKSAAEYLGVHMSRNPKDMDLARKLSELQGMIKKGMERDAEQIARH